jgi:TatD DNase family protein
MQVIDAHAHLTDERLLPEAAAVAARARAAGVVGIVTIGTTVEDSRAAAALAVELPGVWAAVGIHPHNAEGGTGEALAEIERLAALPEVVAIGETGLDYHYDNAPRERQRDLFRRHLALGARLDLPVVVHCRDADDDCRALLREAGAGTRGVLHCFVGGRPLLEAALEIGWYVSFSGMVTFKNFQNAELLRAVPLDRLLVETDSPYLAPVPHRGKRNEPAFVTHVAARAAELRGEDPAELAAATTRNARTLYRMEA